MNYYIRITNPDGSIVFAGTIDLTPFGLDKLLEQLRNLNLGNRITGDLKIKEILI